MNDAFVIIGAGPAGLSAARELVRLGARPVVLEADSKVGGIARTETYRGFHFDIGGHRFLTKLSAIDQLWKETLGPEFIEVARMSRIYYRDRFFSYPLNVMNALSNLGPVESARILLSYLRAQVFPSTEEETFEQWMINRFGRRLYLIFFKTYTEKVWGIPCDEIRADWAAQRIMNLSLISVVANALFGTQKAKTLVDRFHYPIRGPGMMWRRFQKIVNKGGGEVRLSTRAEKIIHQDGRVLAVAAQGQDGPIELPASQVISTMPINHLMASLDPAPPPAVLKAAQGLSYRAFVLVGLILKAESPFPDQWIYIHSPAVKVGRIQNFKNWSPHMAPDPEWTNVGMEYFCSKGDAIWSMADGDLIQQAARELDQLGLARQDQVEDGFVIRQPGAYPVYDQAYEGQLKTIRDYLEGFSNLQTIGRNGMHRYNNMDHSMQTGILAARNIHGENHDLWSVNEADDYLEDDAKARAKRLAPERIVMATFTRMDKTAFGCAVGTVSGLALFLATAWLVIKGGDVVGPTLNLLSQYFPGYSVSWFGTVIGLLYGALCGFAFGWATSALRNFFMAFYVFRVKKIAELRSLKDFIDHL
jgi:protoporphyrinogen oxidase